MAEPRVQISVYMPVAVYASLCREAAEEDRSVNQVAVRRIRAAGLAREAERAEAA